MTETAEYNQRVCAACGANFPGNDPKRLDCPRCGTIRVTLRRQQRADALVLQADRAEPTSSRVYTGQGDQEYVIRKISEGEHIGYVCSCPAFVGQNKRELEVLASGGVVCKHIKAYLNEVGEEALPLSNPIQFRRTLLRFLIGKEFHPHLNNQQVYGLVNMLIHARKMTFSQLVSRMKTKTVATLAAANV